jgi:hypothetical protein
MLVAEHVGGRPDLPSPGSPLLPLPVPLPDPLPVPLPYECPPPAGTHPLDPPGLSDQPDPPLPVEPPVWPSTAAPPWCCVEDGVGSSLWASPAASAATTSRFMMRPMSAIAVDGRWFGAVPWKIRYTDSNALTSRSDSN